MRLDKHINPNDPESALESARNRINYMATLHEKIYKSSDLTSIDIADYLPDVAKSLLTLYNNPINLQTNLDHATIDLDTAIPLGLILTELINNTIKYAFPNGEEGNLLITFNKEKTHGILTVMDDGIGLPENFNIEELDSLGFTVIKTLTQQIEGSLIQIKDIKGTGFKIFFPIKKRKKM
jgi:two-component sensor histidine kinase